MLIFIVSIITIVFFKNYKYFLNDDFKKVSPSINFVGYRLFYADQKNNFENANIIFSKMLYSNKYNLRGKPDYIFVNCKFGDMIVVELKSGMIGQKKIPYYSDLMQLAAYFLIVEEQFGVKVKTGRIIYKDYMFVIKNTKKIKLQILNILDNMRTMLTTGKGEYSKSFLHCRHCVCKDTICK